MIIYSLEHISDAAFHYTIFYKDQPQTLQWMLYLMNQPFTFSVWLMALELNELGEWFFCVEDEKGSKALTTTNISLFFYDLSCPVYE